MKKATYILLIIILSSGFYFIKNDNLNKYNIIKNNTDIEFSIADRLGNDRTGKFDAPKGTIEFDKNNPEKCHFDVNIDVKSINTNNSLRDKDLLSSHFFEASKFPTMNFVSKKITTTTNGYEVTGDMTIKDITKEVKIPFNFIDNPEGGKFESKFKINRLDYNVGASNELIGNDVNIKIKLAVNRSKKGI